MFPGYIHDEHFKFYNIKSELNAYIEDVTHNLDKQIRIVLRSLPENEEVPEEEIKARTKTIIKEFLKRIPGIREMLETDVDAFYDGDPAAFNKTEIILTYPGFYAITVSRIAHELHVLGVPMIPRIMTEYAHKHTGIDIHPGVTIGKYFFIDHGTGVVIGETAVIGDHVKIYQGVTIGALSTRGGQNLRGKKRHPTIEDNVTVYAGASILGGETVIGEGAVIGSNVFLTSSVSPGARVSIKNQELSINGESGRKIEAKDFAADESWFYII